jgi:hypothetical protein
LVSCFTDDVGCLVISSRPDMTVCSFAMETMSPFCSRFPQGSPEAYVDKQPGGSFLIWFSTCVVFLMLALFILCERVLGQILEIQHGKICYLAQFLASHTSGWYVASSNTFLLLGNVYPCCVSQ